MNNVATYPLTQFLQKVDFFRNKISPANIVYLLYQMDPIFIAPLKRIYRKHHLGTLLYFDVEVVLLVFKRMNFKKYCEYITF